MGKNMPSETFDAFGDDARDATRSTGSQEKSSSSRRHRTLGESRSSSGRSSKNSSSRGRSSGNRGSNKTHKKKPSSSRSRDRSSNSRGGFDEDAQSSDGESSDESSGEQRFLTTPGSAYSRRSLPPSRILSNAANHLPMSPASTGDFETGGKKARRRRLKSSSTHNRAPDYASNAGRLSDILGGKTAPPRSGSKKNLDSDSRSVASFDASELSSNAASRLRERFHREFPNDPVPSDLILRQLYKNEKTPEQKRIERYKKEFPGEPMPSDEVLKKLFPEEETASQNSSPTKPAKSSMKTPKSLNRDQLLKRQNSDGDMTFATEAGWEQYGTKATTKGVGVPKAIGMMSLQEGDEDEGEEDGGTEDPWNAPAFNPSSKSPSSSKVTDGWTISTASTSMSTNGDWTPDFGGTPSTPTGNTGWDNAFAVPSKNPGNQRRRQSDVSASDIVSPGSFASFEGDDVDEWGNFEASTKLEKKATSTAKKGKKDKNAKNKTTKTKSKAKKTEKEKKSKKKSSNKGEKGKGKKLKEIEDSDDSDGSDDDKNLASRGNPGTKKSWWNLSVEDASPVKKPKPRATASFSSSDKKREEWKKSSRTKSAPLKPVKPSIEYLEDSFGTDAFENQPGSSLSRGQSATALDLFEGSFHGDPFADLAPKDSSAKDSGSKRSGRRKTGEDSLSRSNHGNPDMTDTKTTRKKMSNERSSSRDRSTDPLYGKSSHSTSRRQRQNSSEDMFNSFDAFDSTQSSDIPSSNAPRRVYSADFDANNEGFGASLSATEAMNMFDKSSSSILQPSKRELRKNINPRPADRPAYSSSTGPMRSASSGARINSGGRSLQTGLPNANLGSWGAEIPGMLLQSNGTTQGVELELGPDDAPMSPLTVATKKPARRRYY